MIRSATEIKYRYCNRCHRDWPVAFFRRNTSRCTRTSAKLRRPICKGCQRTEEDNKKTRNRFREKARSTIARHARKFVESGILDLPEQLTSLCGWTVDRLEHDFRHSYDNTCAYCWKPFNKMPHGLGDVSIDIVDPKRLPDYRTNTKIVCVTCNKEKQRTSPGEFATTMQCWRKWEELWESGPVLPLFAWAKKQREESNEP